MPNEVRIEVRMRGGQRVRESELLELDLKFEAYLRERIIKFDW